MMFTGMWDGKRFLLQKVVPLIIACTPFLTVDVPAQSTNRLDTVPTDPSAASPERMNLQLLSLDELRSKLEETENALPELAKKSQTLDAELRELRIASHTDQAVLALQDQIEQLKQQINLVIDQLPDVAAKKNEVEAAKKALFNEMQLRTTIMAVIAQKEKEGADFKQ